MEAPDAQSGDDEDDRYQEGGAVEESAAAPAAPTLAPSDDKGASAGGGGLIRRMSMRGVLPDRAAAQRGRSLAASGCRRRGAAGAPPGAGGAPRRLRGRGAHIAIVGCPRPVNLLGGTPARARLHLSQVFVEIR